MKLTDFNYTLPKALIAQSPLTKRTDSRLMYLPAQADREDKQFVDLPSLLGQGDLLVLNDTRVMPARLFGRKRSGAKLELLVERILTPHSAWCHIRCNRSPAVGAILWLEEQIEAEVVAREGRLFQVSFDHKKTVRAWLRECGHTPLPPYIERSDHRIDRQRYQTVFAKKSGAVAAPTAGLHFDRAMLERLENKGVDISTVTLHVGAGTFQPVHVENIGEHIMHSESVDVPAETCEKINRTRSQGGRVIAVGTTVLRSLESLPAGRVANAWSGDTDLFIYPGFSFRFVDVLITNFHLPKSTLLMLVCAFAGYEKVMSAYRHAVSGGYRFFSYGDAMFIEKALS